MEDIRLLFFLHIVESALMTFFGLKLWGFKAKVQNILLVGAIQGLLVYLVRGLYIINDIPLGTHSFITLISLILLIHAILKFNWNIAILVGVSAECLVFLGSYTPIMVLNWLNISMDKLMDNPWLFASIGLTENIVVVAVGLFCSLTGFNMKNFITGNIAKKFLPIIILVLLQAFFNIYFTIYYQWYQSSEIFEITTQVVMGVSFLVAIVTIYLIVSLVKFMNVSQEQEKESLLRKNNETLIETLRLIRHDFNNHITVLNGLVQLGKHSDAEDYLKTLSTEMKSFSNLTSLKQQSLVIFFINKMREAEDSGVEVKFNIKSSLANFSISTDKITKIFGNLIDNATYELKNAKQPEKVVLIEIAEDRHNYYFSIIDNGPLVPEEICEKVFERGFTTKGAQGSGFGLHIAKKAVEQKGGKLFLEQSAEQGVKFTCSFPIDLK